MRPISEETLAILKGQNLTGQNRFAHSLRIEGADYYSDVKQSIFNTIISNSFWADYCIRSDGKVLFAYLQNATIYLKVINSEYDMLSSSLSGEGGLPFYSLSGKGYAQCFSLIRLKNGRILLFINDPGSFENGLPYKLMVFESLTGLGNDFSLKSIINSSTRIAAFSVYLRNYLAKPTQDDDKSIWIFAGVRTTEDGFDVCKHAFYKSIDGGQTWTQKFLSSMSSSNVVRYEIPRSITIIKNTVILPVIYSYGYVMTHLYISSDKGETWSLNTNNFSNLPISRTGSGSSLWHELIDFYYDKDDYLYSIIAVPNTLADVYRLKPNTPVDYTLLNNMNNWSLVQAGVSRYLSSSGFLSISPRGIIHFMTNNNGSITDTGLLRDEYNKNFNASSISVNKGKGGANSANIIASNEDGVMNPFNPDNPLYGVLKTNKQIIIKQGYGEEIVETFTGLIDGFEMTTWPQTTQITLRDNLKKALDQIITYGNQHTIQFDLQPIENIVGYLCYLAGLDVGEVDPTGIQVAKTFSWESYADCFQFLGDLASFEWGCDEYGKFYFRRDYQPDDMFVAYTFEEGVDITALNYSIKDDDLYYKVAVFGKSGETVISYEAPFLDAAAYNLPQQKILKIDATEATTIGELRKIAERAIALMQSRTAVVKFSAIAVPWLQVGDFIGVYERSTGASSIYRISSLSLEMTSDSFTMSVDAYYYGDSIVPGELPTNTATQTVAPATNIIPEMTSNTAPSGVARSSSVYSSSYEPWQAFNSTDSDNYWNAITNNGWIEYQFDEKVIVDKYTVKARQALAYNDAMPKDWTFEGFDGEKWIVLDTRTNQSAWGISEVRTYKFTNTAAYSKYRLNVSRNNGYIRLQIEQIAMFYGGGA